MAGGKSTGLVEEHRPTGYRCIWTHYSFYDIRCRFAARRYLFFGVLDRQKTRLGDRIAAARGNTRMLYVFRNNNGLQIAWNSEVPKAFRQSRSSDKARRMSIFGFIRTSSSG